MNKDLEYINKILEDKNNRDADTYVMDVIDPNSPTYNSDFAINWFQASVAEKMEAIKDIKRKLSVAINKNKLYNNV